MAKQARYLVTTADERTWKFDRPIVFLGDWCRLYERRHVWESMDAVVAPPYGLSAEQKIADHAKVAALESELLLRLSKILNQHHAEYHDHRYWKMILGHWLRRYISVMLNRISTLIQCARDFDLTGTVRLSLPTGSAAIYDSQAAIAAFNSDHWNNNIYVDLIRLLNLDAVQIEIEHAGSGSLQPTPPFSLGAKFSLMREIKKMLRMILRFPRLFVRANDGFVLNTYLSKLEEFQLQLLLGQVPQLWDSVSHQTQSKIDPELRAKLGRQLVSPTDDHYTQAICDLLFNNFPVCYLEGYAELIAIGQRQNWPKQPKLIFTSNNFDTDEVFKVWAAAMVERGAKYIVGQHGNNYGTHRYLDFYSIEEQTSDKFITWGWQDGLKQHTPAFLLKKNARSSKSNYSHNGGLLLIEVCKGHAINTWDVTAEFSKYFQDQRSFVDALSEDSRSKLVIRLHPGFRTGNWGELERWKDLDPTINLNVGDGSIGQLISRSRLVVHSYDSTGILETFVQNIPTIAFWQNGLEHIRETARPYYQLLVDAGIVHFTPESAAAKINSVWNNVPEWWQRNDVQQARIQFCNRYAKLSDHPAHEIKGCIN